MYQNMKSDDWILCTSKTTPGKLYYFNIRSGEALWKHEVENMSNKNPTSYQRVFGDNMHIELKEPPATSFANQLPKSGHIYNAMNTINFNRLFEKNVNYGSNESPDNVNACQFPDIGPTRTISSPIFASSTCLKIVPNEFSSNMWAPILSQMFGQESVKTQNERDVSVHALPVPLSKHYKNYEEPRFNYHLEIKRGAPNLMVTSTPIGKRVNAFNYKPNKYNDTSKSTQTEFVLAETSERANSAGLSLNPALFDINKKIHRSGMLITYNDYLSKTVNNCEPKFNFHDAIQNNVSEEKILEPKTDKSNSIKTSQNSVSSTSQCPRKIGIEKDVPKISELTNTFRTNLDINGLNNIQEPDSIITQNQLQKFTANLEPRKPLSIQKTDYIPKLCQELQFTDSNLKTMKLTSDQKVDYVTDVSKQTQFSDSNLESKNSHNNQNAGYIPKVCKELQYPYSEAKKSSFGQNINIPEASNKLQIPKSKEMNHSSAYQEIGCTAKVFKELDMTKTDATLMELAIPKASLNMPSVFDPDNTTEDLRLLLNARKRSNAQISNDNEKKTTLEEPLLRKKRVSFKEDPIEDVIDAPQDVLQIQVNNSDSQSHQLLERNGSNLSQNCRYVLVDLDILFENLDVVVDFVKKDEENRLFIPRVMSEVIESISLGDSRGRQNVVVARKLYRVITFPPPRVVVRNVELLDRVFEDTGSLLSCCLHLQRLQYRVVHISNDKTTQERAQTYKIPCYTLSEISNYVLSTAPQTNYEKTDNHNNFLLCNLYDFNSNFTYEEQTEIQTDVIKLRKLSSASSDSKKIVLDDKSKEIKISFSNDKLDGNQNVLGNNQKEINNNQNVVTSQDSQHEDDTNHTDRESSVSSVFFVDKESNKISKTKNILTAKNEKISNYINYVSKQSMNLKRFDITANSKANVDEFNKENKLGDRENDLNNVKDTKNDSENIRLQNFDKLIRSFKIPKFSRNTESEGKMKMWSLDDNLMRFIGEGDEVGEKIVKRIEEWMCSLRQVMEETLKDLLKDQRAMEKLSRIGNICECLECVLISYKDHNKIKIITGKLLQLLRENILKNGLFCNEPFYFSGKLNPDIKSDDFMKIIGCSILLIEQLKLLHTDNEQLVDAELSLHNILESLMKNDEPVIAGSPSKTISTVASGSKYARRNYIKEVSQIKNYIEKHFVQTSLQKEALDERFDIILANKEKPIIFRTLGRNVNTVKIDNKNSMTLENAKDNHNAESAEKIPKKPIITNSNVEIITNKKLVDDGNKEPFENMVIHKPNDKYYDTKFIISNKISSTTNEFDNIDIEDRGNTFGTTENGPKVLRNLTLLDLYEKKFKENQLLNKENESKYLETHNANNKCNGKTLDDSAFVNESKTSVDCAVSSNNHSKIEFPLQKFGIENSCTSLNIKNNNNDNSTDDSGYSNETYKHNPLKMFIHNLSLVFSSVRKFIDNTISQIREEKLNENNRYDLIYKTGQCEEQLDIIIEDLKKIIQRESNEDNSNSLQSIMRKEKNKLYDDTFSWYIRNIQKCLRNATLLRDIMKLMYNLINGDYESLSPVSV